MIRATVEASTADPHPLTIRTAIEWYKNQATTKFHPFTAEETRYVDGRWATLVDLLAKEHEVPLGWLSSSLAQLAQHELALMQSAELEARASGVEL